MGQEFHALQGVSFEVKQGEILGIIGRNGAGKSTLLKILSRVTAPTSGEVRVKGRIASLLEVGTGFHPELTGRENVFLNGAILGMNKAEIKKKFDEIVDFSGVEEFIDTPVKRYSSGMYVRLAFAVAAHLEPEILIVDEVLAVGDQQFQSKCLGKMQEVSKGGRTVLFVSHQMPAVLQLTKSVAYLGDGKLIELGPTAVVTEKYLAAGRPDGASDCDLQAWPREIPDLSRNVELCAAWIQDQPNRIIPSGTAIPFTFRVRGRKSIPAFRISLTLFRATGEPVGSFFSRDDFHIQEGKESEVAVILKNHNLAPGNYYCGVATGTGNHATGHTDFDIVLKILPFEVLPPEGKNGVLSYWYSGWGPIRFDSIESRIHGL
jgi:lipopolysaccharide transport system ATP-binding protein